MGKSMIQRMLEQKEAYDNYFKQIETATYTCMACGKDGLTRQQRNDNAYVIGVDGGLTGTPKLAEQLVACSPECRKQLVPKLDYGFLMQGVGVQKRFFKSRIEMFKDNEQLFEYIQNWLKDPNQGLLINGPTGTGKTTMAAALAYELRKQERKVKFVPYSQMVTDANGAIFLEDMVDFLAYYTKYEFLFVDEIGKDYLTEKGKQAISNLFRLIYDNEKKIVITTNYDMAELAKVIDERLESRLVEMCIQINLTGEDKRLSK